MKNLITILLLFFGFSFATERVTVTCDFEALAEGYTSFTTSANMLLTGKIGNGNFLNKDGTSSYDITDEFCKNENIKIAGAVGVNEIYFCDGKLWHELDLAYVDDYGKLYLHNIFNLNSGNVKCSWKKGWR